MNEQKIQQVVEQGLSEGGVLLTPPVKVLEVSHEQAPSTPTQQPTATISMADFFPPKPVTMEDFGVGVKATTATQTPQKTEGKSGKVYRQIPKEDELVISCLPVGVSNALTSSGVRKALSEKTGDKYTHATNLLLKLASKYPERVGTKLGTFNGRPANFFYRKGE